MPGWVHEDLEECRLGTGGRRLSEKIEYSFRSAIGADAPKVAALVNAAYGPYVERIGMLPRPMTDDYAEVIANQQVTVAESHGTIVGVIVLTVDDEGFLIDNVAVDPSHRGKGLGKALLEFAEAEARRTLNPDCEHLLGDMRTLRLGRAFDVVFIHDAIDYMTTKHDLRLALESAFVHCALGGLALVVPDHIRETFEPSTDHGGSDGEGRALRYLEWMYYPDDIDTTYKVEYAYALREEDQPTRSEHEQRVRSPAGRRGRPPASPGTAGGPVSLPRGRSGPNIPRERVARS